jgi:RNA polymerase sigma-70 factor (ECF subfamily)
MDFSQLYMQYKPLLFSIAYRMLGLIQDAEDIVQDVFVTLQQQNPEDIRNIKSYLGKMVTNRCINELKSSRKTKVDYVGPWLPEPIVEQDLGDPARLLERHEDVAFAFLVLIQTLAPAERAVFVLRETLDYSFEEIAEVIDKTTVNCRKLYSRAKRKIALEGQSECSMQPFQPDRPDLVRSFSSAFMAGDISKLVELLSDDAILLTDGGGKVRAAVNPIYGKERVLALLSFSISNNAGHAKSLQRRINGHEGFLLIRNNRLYSVYTFAFTEDGSAISRVYITMNPDKLKNISEA